MNLNFDTDDKQTKLVISIDIKRLSRYDFSYEQFVCGLSLAERGYINRI